MAQRRLQVVLELDTGRYSGRLSAAGAQLKVFSGTVNSSSQSVKKLQSSFDNLGNHMSTPLSKLRDYVLILGNIRLAILNVRDIAVGWVGSLLKQSAEVERLTMLMKGLSTASTEFGKNREAEQNLARLFNMARENGFAVKELADAYVKLKTGGIDPMNGSLQSLTDAVAKFGGGSDVMHRASIAIQQMAGKGVISMEELRQQLGEAVPTAMWDMARAAGMSMKEFVDIVSKGKVQAKPALQLMFQEFERMYSGAGAAKANTLLGQVEQFKTNLTQLSTSFSGMAMGQTENLRGYMEEQALLFEQAKITREQYESAMQGGGGGAFQGATDALKEINMAMRSDEARVAMRQLGDAINSVMQGLMSVGKFIVHWRVELVGALVTVATAYGLLKAVQIGKWFYDVSRAALVSTQNIVTGVTPLPGILETWKVKAEGVVAAQTRLAATQQLTIRHAQQQIASANQLQASAAARVTTLTNERNAIQANVMALRRQVDATEATLRMGERTGVWRDRATGQITSQTKALNANQVACNRLAAAERLLATTSRQLAAAETQEAAAASTATAAQGRLNVAVGAGTLAMRAKAAAARLAAGAVTFLGRAMSIALGPIGMIALALYAAAEAAGVFENRANRAAEAAARLMQGIASVEDMQKVQEDQKGIAGQFRAKSEALNRGGRWVSTGPKGDGGQMVWKEWTPAERAQMMAERAALKKRYDSNSESLRRGEFGLRNQAVDNAYTGFDMDKTEHFNKLDADYRAGVASGKINHTNQAQHAEALNQQKLAFINARIAATEKRKAMALAADPKADTRGWDALIGRLNETKEGFTSMHQPIGQLRQDMIGAGKETGETSKKLTDAEKAAKKAKAEFDRAREKYDGMLDQQSGEIASLEEQLAGGDKTGTARFEALKEAGFYADATNEELEKLAANFAKIDELNSELSFEKSLGSLNKEMAKTAAEATAMWDSLNKGTFESDARDAQYKSRFANLLEGVDDPEKIAQINAQIDQVIANIKRADAAQVVAGWQQMAEEIEISLMSEDAARQANFDREVRRQWDLIATTKMSVAERQRAEETFERWRKAAEERMRRESEHGVVKLARQWVQLGQNIDQALTNAFSGLVDGLFDAEFSFKKWAKELLKTLLKIIIQAMIAYAILSAMGMTPTGANGQKLNFGQFMGAEMGAGVMGGGSGVTWTKAGTKHTGGVIGGRSSAMAIVGAHVWKNAQTRHDGGWIGGRGLKKGEVPIIGMEKELVLTEEQQKLLGNQLSGGGRQTAPNATVNIINNSGTAVDAEVSEPEWNGQEMVVGIVIDALSKQGRLRDAVAHVGGNK